MTEKKANEIFRTKYPEGEIVRRNNSSAGNKFWVTFKPNGKVYYYACSTYSELLGRFGFKVVYKHDVENVESVLKSYRKQLEDLNKGIKPAFLNIFGVYKSDEEAMEYEINEVINCINKYEKMLKHFKEDCIID